MHEHGPAAKNDYVFSICVDLFIKVRKMRHPLLLAKMRHPLLLA